jgi:hypothetical protein
LHSIHSFKSEKGSLFTMSLTCQQSLDTTDESSIIYHNILRGQSGFEVNVINLEYEIKEITECDLDVVDVTDLDTFDFSQLVNCQNIDPQPSDASFVNYLCPTNPSLLRSNTANHFKCPPQTATSQDVPQNHQQHEQCDLSENRRLLTSEPTETPYPSQEGQGTSWPVPPNTKLFLPSSAENISSAPELLGEEPIFDNSVQQKPLPPKRRYTKGLGNKRISNPAAKDRHRSKKAIGNAQDNLTARQEAFRVRNRQAAKKCRDKRRACIADLMKRANAKLPDEIEEKMLELEALRTIAVEHCRICPNPGPELLGWFEKQMFLTNS